MPRMSGPVAGNKFADVIFERYHAELDLEGREVDEQFKEGIARLQDFISSNDKSNHVCLICLEPIAPNAAVWTCRESCFCVLHLVCAQGWAVQQLKAAAAKAASQAANPDLSQGPAHQGSRTAPGTWGCPKCRADYPGLGAPREYWCMCGKVADPGFDPWLLPHTCGATCDRQLQPPCGHDCVLLCHPGPCPPCPRQVTAGCYCGKAKAQRRCGAARWSCTRLCGRLLPCGHRCPLKCHAGDCGPCRLTGTYSCRCGGTTETRSCQERDFQCQEVCRKTLQCGQCRCLVKCHAGDCGLCAKAGSQTCPCGKVLHTDLPCNQEAPTCGATCGKLLPCGRHHCQERCHAGPCPETCRLLVDKSCACGQTQRRMPCSQPLRCERRCTVQRSCGRHQCKRRCCSGDCPPCDQPCGRKLRCGNHLCPNPCHAGPCQPCPLTATIACACGRTSYSTPCGTESSAKPPKCPLDCPVRRKCAHAQDLPPHPCHFGPCPSCTRRCGLVQECGHACPAKCHHPEPSPVPEYTAPPPMMAPGIQLIKARKAAPPAPPPAVQVAEQVRQTELCPAACPPCQQMLPMTCHGDHVTFLQHCSAAAPFTCGAACGQPLKCGNHACAVECHPLDAERPGEDCRQCELPCQRLRACEHPCSLACHPEACPECQEEVRLPCHCTCSTISLECSELQQAKAEGPEAVKEALTCGKVCRRLLETCPHLCEATCHAGPCPSECSTPVTVRCACRRRKERRPCSLVRQQLRQRNLPAVIDDSAAAQLLGCDSKCHQLKDEKKHKRAEHSSQKPAEAASPVPTKPALATVPTLTAATSKERKRALQKERVAERERALLQKQRAERWQAFRRKLWRCLPYICLALLVVFLLFVLVMAIFRPTPEEMELYYEMTRSREEMRAELEHQHRRELLREVAHKAFAASLHDDPYDYCEECGEDVERGGA